MEYLTFTLYGPMAAWGEIAVGQERPVTPQPSRSALLGIIGAALGLERDDPQVKQLNDGYGTGVCLMATGSPLRDYHTAQVPSASALKHHAAHRRRTEVFAGPLNTILSSREYNCDNMSQAAIWARADAPWTLADLKSALLKPRFPLYLGRKSCPPALPLAPEVLTASGLDEVFRRPLDRCSGDVLKTLASPPQQWQIFWDTDGDAGTITPTLTFSRRDQSVNRSRWHFTERPVHFAQIEAPAMEDAHDVFQ